MPMDIPPTKKKQTQQYTHTLTYYHITFTSCTGLAFRSSISTHKPLSLAHTILSRNSLNKLDVNATISWLHLSLSPLRFNFFSVAMNGKYILTTTKE